MKTVFYAWQSDLPNNTNRSFLEQCLQLAITNANASRAPDDQLILDKDTQGVSGLPVIAEVTAAVMENLVRVDEQTYVYRLTHSKTDQAGTEHNADADKPIVGPAADALTAWLEASGVKSGAIFRRIRKTKAVEPLLPQAVWHIVKRRARLAGLEGDFGAHSLRSGYVTEAGRQNVPIKEAMGLTGHRSMVTFMRYFQTGVVQNTQAANLLGNATKRN